MIEEITLPEQKTKTARQILEALTEWFELEAGREAFIAESAEQPFLAAKENGNYIGFLTLKETGKATVELAVMGVLPEYHRQGIGRRLVEAAKTLARRQGYQFMQVKTVQSGVYESYDRTNLFYQSCGFQELEVFPLLWDENNPCQVYVMAL